MNTYNVIFPYFIVLIAVVSFGIILFLVYIFTGILRIAIFHKTHGGYEHVGITRVFGLNRFQMGNLFFAIGTLLTLLFFLFIFNLTATHWIRATPTTKWESKINEADTVIVFGFGLEEAEDGNGQYSAGEANVFLYKWTVKHTNPKILLVQEGIWVASDTCKILDVCDSTCVVDEGYRMTRMHMHDEHIYVNTLDSAYCAFQRIEQLYNSNVVNNKVVIVAHDQQLQRAVWDFMEIQDAKETRQKFELIVPEIPDTPYPSRSSHWHTRHELLYQSVELFYSRIRDYFASVPNDCRAPCAACEYNFLLTGTGTPSSKPAGLTSNMM